MIESTNKVIGGTEYTVRQLTATPAYTLLTKLTRIVGPAFGALSAGDSASSKISEAINVLASKLDETEVTVIVKQLVGCVDIDGTPLSKTFEAHFHGGNLSEMFKLLGFVLEVNYADFFGGLESVKIKAAAFLAAQPSKSQTTSGGPPGV